MEKLILQKTFSPQYEDYKIFALPTGRTLKFSRIFRCVCLRKFINANPALYQKFQTELEIRIIQPNHPPYEYYITILHKHRSACFASFRRFFMTCRIQHMLISLLLFFSFLFLNAISSFTFKTLSDLFYWHFSALWAFPASVLSSPREIPPPMPLKEFLFVWLISILFFFSYR